jgi:ATP-dependent Clp protease ATP-binding subunit ClpC
MPKINVYLPDELAEAVKAAGVPVSAICQRALEQAVRRVTAIRETVLNGPDGEDPTAPSRLRHFTDRARTAVRLGLERAAAESAAAVGTEHLLAGVLAEGGNLALHVLRAIDVEPEAVLQELSRQAVSAGAPAGGPERRFGGPAANALELAVTEATALGHNYVGCEHLLLGLLAEPDGTAGHVLRGMGADYRLTRHAVTAALAGYVHLRAQATPGAADPAAVSAHAVAAAVRRELEPVVRRLERLEERVAGGAA